MTQAAVRDNDIVWPDEEHLFAAEDFSLDDRAVSQSSEGWTGLNSVTDREAAKNEPSYGADGDAPAANEYWDHDDRNQDASNLR